MNTPSELEQKIRTLEDIEAIKKLKARYWYCADNKLWDGFADCYAEDAVFESPMLKRMEGRDFIVKVLKKAMANIKTAHQGHNPEIKIISDTTATGRWALNDRVETSDGKYFTGHGYYEDEYVKVNGSWKIKKSTLTYTFQQSTLYSP